LWRSLPRLFWPSPVSAGDLACTAAVTFSHFRLPR
jgi:hypothetical protein